MNKMMLSITSPCRNEQNDVINHFTSVEMNKTMLSITSPCRNEQNDVINHFTV